jgi:hypothetical protein
MSKFSFSLGNLRRETPIQFKRIYRIFMLVSTLWVATIQPKFNLDPILVADIDKWILVINSLVYHICQHFGWKIDSEEQDLTSEEQDR